MKEKQNSEKTDTSQDRKEFDVGPIGIILTIVGIAIGIVKSIAEKSEDGATLHLMANLCFVVGIVLCVILAIRKPNQRFVYIAFGIIIFLITILANMYFLGIVQLSNSTPSPVITTSPTTPIETTPITLPTSGTSTSGTMLRDVQYNEMGKIVRASEKFNDKWVEWEYVYSDTGAFKYRKRNIGSVDCTLTNSFMTGKDTTYTKLNEKVEKCVGFTLSYSVSNVRRGNYQGEREVYFSSDTNSWRLIGSFEYNSLDRIKIPFVLDPAESFIAFATPRTHPDDSSFNVNQSIVDVWVADYEYVEIVS